MFRTVPIDVVVRSYGLLELVADDHTGTLCGRATSEYHNARARIGEGRLEAMSARSREDSRTTHFQKPNSDRHGNASASQRPLARGDWPWILGESFQDAGELELALRDRKQEASGSKSLHGLTRARSGAVLRAQSEHILNLLWTVLLGSAEHV